MDKGQEQEQEQEANLASPSQQQPPQLPLSSPPPSALVAADDVGGYTSLRRVDASVIPASQPRRGGDYVLELQGAATSAGGAGGTSRSRGAQPLSSLLRRALTTGTNTLRNTELQNNPQKRGGGGLYGVTPPSSSSSQRGSPPRHPIARHPQHLQHHQRRRVQRRGSASAADVRALLGMEEGAISLCKYRATNPFPSPHLPTTFRENTKGKTRLKVQTGDGWRENHPWQTRNRIYPRV